jgi:hypothetical protein
MNPTGFGLVGPARAIFYQASFSGGGLDAGRYGHLVLRIGQSFENENPVGQEQDLRIIVQDIFGEPASFPVSSYSQLLYPDVWWHPDSQLPITKTAMQTVRIPLNVVRAMGADVSHIAFVKLVFDQVGTGTVYLDDLQLSN